MGSRLLSALPAGTESLCFISKAVGKHKSDAILAAILKGRSSGTASGQAGRESGNWTITEVQVRSSKHLS